MAQYNTFSAARVVLTDPATGVEMGSTTSTSGATLAAAAVGGNGTDISTGGRIGCKLVIDVTAISGTTPTLTVTLQGKDPVSGKYYNILSSAAISTVSTTVLTVYPGLTAAANATASDILPGTVRVVTAVAGTTPAVTATVGLSFIGS